MMHHLGALKPCAKRIASYIALALSLFRCLMGLEGCFRQGN
jgi:hypothetical protein